ncbi:hypothetical protein STAS_00654 [Striga asiatica]|uniref:Time for coffee n=1 Tax=Striga asiatica TaxID=4170 RepID=A0A5A7NX72_STRAF|nr:hypothetical protein STAS_00654 [Striga asiatica]
MDQPPESEILSSSGSEKVRGSASGNGLDGRGNSVNSDGREAQAQPQDVKERESGDVKNEDDFCSDSSLTATASSSVADSITVKTNLLVSEEGTQREQKFEFDLMALPPQARSSSPESSAPSDQPPDPTLSTAHAESKPMVCKDEENLLAEEKNIKGTNEETESCKKIDSQPQEIMPVQMNKEGSAAEKSGQPESPISSGCADGLLFIGHMAPPKNSTTVSPSSTRRLITLPSLKRCARHFLIARNIERHQKLMKMDPSRNRADKGLARTPDHVVKEKGGSQIVTSSNVVENKKQLVIQNQKSTLVGASNLLGPISLNQHKAARPISLSNPVGPTSSMDTSQYLQLLQNNNAYHLPTSGSRAHTNILGPNFARPVHPQLLVQNQAIFQSFPEATRQQHIQSNNFVIAEGNKLGIRDDKAERENLAEKAQQPIIPLMSSNFPQNLTQPNSGCLVQSPYWSYSSKTPFSQAQPQTQNQISFSANQKLPTTARAQSPTNSSVSTKTGQNPIFSPQLPKNFSSNGVTPMQAQLFFTNPYSQVQFPHHSAVTSSGLSGPNGIYMQQTRNDPSKAIFGATSDATGGSSIHTARIGGTRLPAGFSYIRPVVQGANQMKPAEQK